MNREVYFYWFFFQKKSKREKILIENNINNLVIYSTKQQLQKDIFAIANVSKTFEIIILKELTKMYEERIFIDIKNYKDFNYSDLKGDCFSSMF